MSMQTPAQPRYEMTEADKARQKKIAAAWKAYHGDLEAPLKKMDGQPDDNVMSNRCKAVVRRGVAFLFGKEVEISVEEGAPQEAQDLLDKVWGRKEERVPLLIKHAMNGAIAGTAFLRIVPDNQGNYRLVVVDPATVCVQTAPQDCDTVLLYCIEYSVSESHTTSPMQVFYREEIQRIDPDGNAVQGMPDTDCTWQIQHWTRVGDRGPWTPAGEPIAWPYSFPPLFHNQNQTLPNDVWGEPDITDDLIGMNNALNLVLSNINRVNKLYGAPILYATGTGQQVIDIKPGKIIGLPLSESKVVAVAIASDIANALAFSDDLRSDMDELTGVPGIATGRLKDMPRGNVSGIALEVLCMALLNKTEEKKCLFGELIITVSKALLVLAGMNADIDITLAWQSPLPHDDLQAVQAAVMKKQVSISDTTLQRELGYDPDEEMELSQSEDAQKLVNFTRGQGMPPESPMQQQPGQPGQPPMALAPEMGNAGGVGKS